MVALNWDLPGERFYEVGVDRGVFYPNAGTPAVWNGLVSVNESASGGEQEPIYLDGRKVYDLSKSEDFSAEIEAYSTPTGFRACDGVALIAPGLFATQQPRVSFGFSYRTLIANDLKLDDLGYKIHLVYNATAEPTSRSNKTKSNQQSVETLKWKVNTVPPPASTYKATAHLVIDSTALTAAKLLAVENALYGTTTTAPVLISQAALITLLTGP